MKLLGAHEKKVANARVAWQEAFSAMAEKDGRVIALVGDLSRSTCTDIFRVRVPSRYFNMGIAEQNMVGAAAGLALSGKIPYCATFAPFASMRAGEQFRTDVCYMNLQVRIVASYGGIVHPGGPTHSGLEDAGIIRGMPNASVISPSDVHMIAKVFDASVDYPGPLYIRLGTGANEPILYDEDYDLVIGKALEARPGKDATIICFGMTLRTAVAVSDELAKDGINVGIVDMHTLKPLDAEAVLRAARRTGRIVTIEDHSIYNGLGSAVAEVILEAGVPCKFKRLGIPDLYPSFGEADRLYEKYGYGAAAGIEAIRGMLTDR